VHLVSIGDYLRLAKRHLVILLLLPIFFAAAGFFTSNSEARVYRSTAQVLLRPNDPNERVGTSAAGTEIQNADRIVRAQASIARGPVVRKQTAAVLGNVSEIEIQDSITTSRRPKPPRSQTRYLSHLSKTGGFRRSLALTLRSPTSTND
jgi:uncharacterized protein involved in exopolysaccharide biosynthesis